MYMLVLLAIASGKSLRKGVELNALVEPSFEDNDSQREMAELKAWKWWQIRDSPFESGRVRLSCFDLICQIKKRMWGIDDPISAVDRPKMSFLAQVSFIC